MKVLPDDRYKIYKGTLGLRNPIYVVQFNGYYMPLGEKSWAMTRAGAITLARNHHAEFLRNTRTANTIRA